MTSNEQQIKQIREHGMMAKGKFELIRHLEGSELTRGQAIRAKCYECCGFCADGKFDCMITSCPLHGFMPYRGRKVADEVIEIEEIEQDECMESQLALW